MRCQYAHVLLNRRRTLLIADPQTAADIEVPQCDAFCREVIDQCQQAIQGFQKGCDVENLTADVAVNTDRV